MQPSYYSNPLLPGNRRRPQRRSRGSLDHLKEMVVEKEKSKMVLGVIGAVFLLAGLTIGTATFLEVHQIDLTAYNKDAPWRFASELFH